MADAVVTLEQVKEQLRLEADDTSQDAHVQRLLDAAQAAVEGYINRGVTLTWPDPTAPQRAVAGQAIALLVEEWFVRGAEAGMPQAVTWLLNRIRVPRI